ncbi:MAG: alpha/beta fold hydrolase [Acidimicrobiia bacterium]
MTAGSHSLVVDGTRLEYRWIGEAPDAAITLVFLHHGLGSVSTWKNFPDRVVAENRIGGLVYSRAGYGRSDPIELPRPLTFMEDEARDVVGKVLDATGVQKAILIGHSDGASIAAVYAGGSGDLRVRGLVLMAPHFFTEEVTRAKGREITHDFEEGDLRERLARHHEHVDIAFQGWADAWQDPGFKDWDITEYLDYIRVPILAIQGEDDGHGTLAHIDALDEIMAPVEKLVLPDCGHSPYLEQPEATLEAITDFVNRLVEVHDESV